MNTADRRAEIISILMVRRRITAKELAEEFNVTIRTIQNDIQALSLGFPIYTRQGGDGGIFVGDNYKPYMNTLTPLELKVLHEMYELADGMLTYSEIDQICMNESTEKVQVQIPAKKLKQYFPESYSKAQMEEVIFMLLASWAEKQ